MQLNNNKQNIWEKERN